MRYLRLALLPLVLAACTEQEPAAPDLATGPELAVAGQSGCYTVEFETHMSGIPPSYTGVVSGDIEGTIDASIDLTTFIQHGMSVHFDAYSTYTITGGIIPELVGRLVQTIGQIVQTQPPDNEPFIQRVNFTDRPVSGVAKWNMTGHGTNDNHELSIKLDFVHQGVICP
jgi:hypothetical protein